MEPHISKHEIWGHRCWWQNLPGAIGDGIFHGKIGPAQWNLTLATFLVEERDSLFTAVFFACQSFAARQRVKRMRDPELLGLCSMNRCSLTLLPIICDIPNLSGSETTRILLR
jgi:hypothetical protein